MGRLGTFAILAAIVGACWAAIQYGGLLGDETPTVAECRAGFEHGLRSSAPEYASALRRPGVRKAVDRFCAEVADSPEGRLVTKNRTPAFVGKLFIEHPSLHRSLCTELMKADLAQNRSALRYVRPHELRRYKRRFCRLSLEYLNPHTATTDLAALLRDHPQVWAPLCASGFQQGANGQPAVRRTFTRLQLAEIGRRACARAVRTGVIDVSGPRGFLDAKIDQRGFDRIVARTARAVVAS